jgi:CRISPR-associated protein Csb1
MIDFTNLLSFNRLLMEVSLKPVQGERFQPTGFPDLGAATYSLPDETEMLLVESSQSIANRLEATAWNQAEERLVDELSGLAYVEVANPEGTVITTSIEEAHRINSPYILDASDGEFQDRLKAELEKTPNGAVDIRHAAKVIFKYDPNSVLHGVFLARKLLAGGRYRLPRLLSSFVEARDVRTVESGGVKNDRINPSGDAQAGYGNVPFHRTEFVARSITAYFNFDVATLKSYGFPEEVERLLIALGLWKIRMLLEGNLRFRTACDLACDGEIKTSDGLILPTLEELKKAMPDLIENCKEFFAKPPVTRVIWKETKKGGKSSDINADDQADEVNA